MHIKEQATERHTLSITVTNEPGVLARIAGMFSARGYNIESLTVADISPDDEVSRITIVTTGTPHVIEQIVVQLDRMVLVHHVNDLTACGPHIERELALVKVQDTGTYHDRALDLAEASGAFVLHATDTSFVFEVTGTSQKIEAFIAQMSAIGTVEVARTGIVAISRGN